MSVADSEAQRVGAIRWTQMIAEAGSVEINITANANV